MKFRFILIQVPHHHNRISKSEAPQASSSGYDHDENSFITAKVVMALQLKDAEMTLGMFEHWAAKVSKHILHDRPWDGVSMHYYLENRMSWTKMLLYFWSWLYVKTFFITVTHSADNWGSACALPWRTHPIPRYSLLHNALITVKNVAPTKRAKHPNLFMWSSNPQHKIVNY